MALDPNGKTQQDITAIETKLGGQGGIIALVVVIVLAIGGYFIYAHHEKTVAADTAPAISAPADSSSAAMPTVGYGMPASGASN
jgi:hypothetical protein